MGEDVTRAEWGLVRLRWGLVAWEVAKWRKGVRIGNCVDGLVGDWTCLRGRLEGLDGVCPLDTGRWPWHLESS